MIFFIFNRDALFFFLLLIDLSKAGILAKLALSGSNSDEVTQNIARGMEILGPAITLDTIVEALMIGVGTLSGVQRLEVLSGFAVMSVIVNYVVFMTFYPACLSLTLDLSRNCNGDSQGTSTNAINNNNNTASSGVERIRDPSLIRALSEEDQKQNPIIQRVKLIMSSGLMIVHFHSRFITFDNENDDVVDAHVNVNANVPADAKNLNIPQTLSQNKTESGDFAEYIMRWLSISTEQIFILILLLALCIKFIFFDRDDLTNQIQRDLAKQIEEEERKKREKEEAAQLAASQRPTIILPPASPPPVIREPSPPRKLALFSISEEDPLTKETGAQTDLTAFDVFGDSDEDNPEFIESALVPVRPPRSIDECVKIMMSEEGAKSLADEELINLVNAGGNYLPLHKIETIVEDAERGVKLRRKILATRMGYQSANDLLATLSYKAYDYSKVLNACCENVLGYVEIPVGYAGPLILDGKKIFVPMATTEGALVASTNRGCKALSYYGVRSIVEDVGMTRAPCVKFPDVVSAAQAKRWMETAENFTTIKQAFDSTSRFARLQELLITIDGPQLYIRFRALTGDAMGMNMVSKGAENALRIVQHAFPEMNIISLSGNFCSDKKPAAINWIKGRGKRVVCESRISEEVLKNLLKTDAKTLVQCNKLKNMAGSAMAGSIGGNNAHAANMVTAIFIATGQDPAQNITSSNCSTNMELHGDNPNDLYMTCTMPSLEVGTVGGGTVLPGQSACLEMLGVKGAHITHPAENSKQLARVICATVMAGEISLMAALVNSDLVKSHMKHNRLEFLKMF